MSVTVLNGSKGIYKHDQTGFVVHDVFSVADVLDCNGCLVYDDSGWAWVAGRDLMLEVRRFGAGGSLIALGQSILRKLKHTTRAISFGQAMNAEWGGSNALGIYVPGFGLTPRAVNNMRIFGLVTNAAAGRGCSPGTFGGRVTNASENGLAKFVNAFSWRMSPTAGNDGLTHSGSNDWYIDGTTTADSTFIGRAIVAVPLTSWEKLLVEWEKAVPNNDESEVKSRIASAKATLPVSLLKEQLGVLPTVYVPIALFSDGNAAVEMNHAPLIGSPTAGSSPRNEVVQYSPYLCPSVPETETGWWITNPLGIGKNGFNVQIGSVPNGGSLLSANYLGGQVLGNPKSFTPGYTPLTAIDNIDLFKILGGLYPRVDQVRTNVSGSTLINRSFLNSFLDESLPSQGAAESSADYDIRQQQVLDNTVMDVVTTLPNHWNFAGQPTFITTTLLNGFLQGATPKITKATACLLMSGHYSPHGRVKRLDVINGVTSRATITIASLMAYTKV